MTEIADLRTRIAETVTKWARDVHHVRREMQEPIPPRCLSALTDTLLTEFRKAPPTAAPPTVDDDIETLAQRILSQDAEDDGVRGHAILSALLSRDADELQAIAPKRGGRPRKVRT